MSIHYEAGEGDLTAVSIAGRLDQLLTPQLEETLLSLLENGHHRLLVDMKDVTYINSGGLRTLVTAWRKARAGGGNLVLCSLNERVNGIFRLAGFDKVFDIYASCQQARDAISSQ